MSTGVETTPILEPLRYPEQDPKLASKRFLDLASIVGPGFILASVTIGNGEVFQATRGGAVFGYTILWTFVLGAIFKATVTYAAYQDLDALQQAMAGHGMSLTDESTVDDQGKVVSEVRVGGA